MICRDKEKNLKSKLRTKGVSKSNNKTDNCIFNRKNGSQESTMTLLKLWGKEHLGGSVS